MSKELEALRNFISECENDWKTQPKRWVDGAINSNVSKYMYSLKSILTPPTAEEVCKALSEWLNKEVPDLFNYKVYYGDGGFLYYNTLGFEDYLVEYYEVDKTMTVSAFLPPHLITLIGRFYEGEIK